MDSVNPATQQSRAIKFRAWDKKNEAMAGAIEPFNQLGAIRLYNTIGKDSDERPTHYPMDTDLELMQFTGLHDKNGKPIYEGDVVDGAYYNERKKFVVEWSDKYAEYYELSSYAESEDGWDPKEMEVIGNIYENPELLKEAS